MLFTASAVCFAHVPLVGHRGGMWGVENTEECFLEGAKYFDALEMDTKVTKDSVIICCHDANFVNMGCTEAESKIATHTLAELQKLTLKQTNLGKEWTGHVCTLDRYLEICRENKCIAYIEIKWMDNFFTYTNANGMPLVFEALKRQNMLDHCIIMSGQPICLEWVRKFPEYDHIPVQYLGMTGTGNPDWNTILAWAQDHNGDIDPECYQIKTKEMVTQAHKMNIKVACWNVGGKSDYLKYKSFGVDYITTDTLRPQYLADYTPREDFIDVKYGPKEPDHRLDSLECNPFDWAHKGDMCLALQEEYNSTYGTELAWAKKGNGDSVFYFINEKWMYWEDVEAKEYPAAKEGFIADVVNPTKLMDYVRNAGYEKWYWLCKYLATKGIDMSNAAIGTRGISAFFLCTTSKSEAWPDLSSAAQIEEFGQSWGWKFCPHEVSAIEDVVTEEASGATKYLRDGQLLIEYKGATYNALGTRL